MSATQEDDYTKLQAYFRNPFDEIESIEVETEKEAADEIFYLEETLCGSSPWQKKIEAIQRGTSLLKGGIHYYKNGNLFSIVPYISKAISNLRPSLVKVACRFVSAQVQVLDVDFVQVFSQVYPVLMKQMLNQNQTISDSCHLTLLEIVKYCKVSEVRKAFFSEYKSPEDANRLVSAEACFIISQTWNTSRFTKSLNTTLESLSNDENETVKTTALAALDIKQGIEDGHPREKETTLKPHGTPRRSPRKASQLPVRSPASKTPKKEEKKPEPIPEERPKKVTFQKKKKPEPPLPPPESSEKTIQDFMPPKTPADIEEFIARLPKEIDNVDPSKLGESLLMIGGQLEQPEIPIDQILTKYKDALGQQILQILESFSFNDWIMTPFLATYDPQAVLQEYAKLPKARQCVLKFILCLIDKKINIQLTDEIKAMIGRIVQANKHHPRIEQVKQLLTASVPIATLQSIANGIISKLNNTQNYSSDVELLLQYFNTTENAIAAVEEIFEPAIPKLIARGTDKQRQITVRFLTQVAPKLKKVSFVSATDALVAVLLDSEVSWRQQAIQCMSALMGDIRVMTQMILYLEQTEDAEMIVLESMALYFKTAPPQRMISVYQILGRKLTPFLSSEDPVMRKYVLSIFVDFRIKIPKEFSVFMRTLSKSQQKLIEMNSVKATKGK